MSILEKERAKNYLFYLLIGCIFVFILYSVVLFVPSAVAYFNKTKTQAFSINEQNQESKVDYQFLEEDINSDGIKEKIELNVKRSEGDVTTTLRVNDISVVVPGQDPIGYFGIVDINEKDNRKEIAVIDMGPSDDYTTSFYYFDGIKLLLTGTIQGSYKEMIFDKLGKITTQTRSKILDTWFFADDYMLSNDHVLVHVPKKMYDRETSVTLLTSLPLQVSSVDAKIITTVQKDESVKIIGCDDVAWCVIKKSNGVEGWFQIENFDLIKAVGLHAQEVFLGLSNAD